MDKNRLVFYHRTDDTKREKNTQKGSALNVAANAVIMIANPSAFGRACVCVGPRACAYDVLPLPL